MFNLKNIVRSFRADAFILKYRDEAGEGKGRLHCNSSFMHYFTEMLGQEMNVEITNVGRKWAWSQLGLSPRENLDFSCFQIDPVASLFFQGKKRFLLPMWVRGEADSDFTKVISARNESWKSDIRRVKRAGFRYEITRNTKNAEYFFEHMYIPYVTRSHRKEVLLMGEKQMISRLEDGSCELLKLFDGDEWVAGILIHYQVSGPRLWSAGVKNSDEMHLRNGAVAGLYYYSSEYLREKGAQKINYGLSRPFLSDGVFQYKKKWGQKVTGVAGSYICLQIKAVTPAIANFLVKNPFIHFRKEGLAGAVFYKTDEERDQAIKVALNSSGIGLDNIGIYKIDDNEFRLDRELSR